MIYSVSVNTSTFLPMYILDSGGNLDGRDAMGGSSWVWPTSWPMQGLNWGQKPKEEPSLRNKCTERSRDRRDVVRS